MGDTIAKIDSSQIVAAVTTAVNDTISLMTALLPIALTVFAAIWGVRKALKFFKGATN